MKKPRERGASLDSLNSGSVTSADGRGRGRRRVRRGRQRGEEIRAEERAHVGAKPGIRPLRLERLDSTRRSGSTRHRSRTLDPAHPHVSLRASSHRNLRGKKREEETGYDGCYGCFGFHRRPPFLPLCRFAVIDFASHLPGVQGPCQSATLLIASDWSVHFLSERRSAGGEEVSS